MILAFECSTRHGQIALCEGDAVIAERTWEDAAARHAAFWPALQSLVNETALRWPALEAVAAGRGPGSFSGLRAAITAARVLAAPDRIPVVAVSSGEAVARAAFIAAPESMGPFVVAGDARRGSIWYGVFHARHGVVRQEGGWSLASCPDFPLRVPAGARVVTSDRERLIQALGDTAPALLEAWPTAAAIAHLAGQRLLSGAPSEPVEPLYLHPPVQP